MLQTRPVLAESGIITEAHALKRGLLCTAMEGRVSSGGDPLSFQILTGNQRHFVPPRTKLIKTLLLLRSKRARVPSQAGSVTHRVLALEARRMQE